MIYWNRYWRHACFLFGLSVGLFVGSTVGLFIGRSSFSSWALFAMYAPLYTLAFLTLYVMGIARVTPNMEGKNDE